MDKSAPIVVARTWTDSEASVIKSLLESYSIPCHYSSKLPHRIYPVSGEGLGEIRVFVPASLAQEAKRILADYALLMARREESILPAANPRISDPGTNVVRKSSLEDKTDKLRAY